MSKMKRRNKLAKIQLWSALLPVRRGAVWAELQAIAQWQRNRACAQKRRR
jgi:hypothetical protein